MYTLVFSVVWTVLAAAGVIAFYFEHGFADQPLVFRIFFPIFPFAGIPFIWGSLRRLRRFKSVRHETSAGGAVYIWNELDGSERRSATDPRIKWDEEDRDFGD